ncbi:MAG: hypothetical protein HYX59_00510 [Elusimicrobia bacterium]|nr:hypothetical protein [Elusimicrobiota bacterium]
MIFSTPPLAVEFASIPMVPLKPSAAALKDAAALLTAKARFSTRHDPWVTPPAAFFTLKT